MPTIKLCSHVGEDGILHLDVPVALKETDLEITMTVEPIPKKLTHEEARKMFEESRKQYQGRIFSDSVELLREDRQR